MSNIENWQDFFLWHYTSGPGQNQAVLVSNIGRTPPVRPNSTAPPPGPANRPPPIPQYTTIAPPPTQARIAPLARWLLYRWEHIHRGSTLAQRLGTLRWRPNTTSPQYRSSFNVLSRNGSIPPNSGGHRESSGVRAGEHFFAGCVTAYVLSLGEISLPLIRSLCHGDFGGGIGETTTLDPLSNAEEVAFKNKIRNWGMINASPGPSPGPNLPSNGLPYGQPVNPRAGIGNHKARIAAIHRLVVDGQDSSHLRNTAGIVETHAGPPPYLFRWF